MKTIHKLITALLLLITLEGFGQYVSIPDTSFGAWLNASNFCTTGSSATGWYLDTTCTTVTTQTHILISAGYSMQDLNGLQYFKSLQTLIIWNNPINSLPALSNSLRSVYIYNNQFTYLPILPDSVTTLVFNGNPLTSIPHLPLHLRELHLTNDMLYSLPALPASIDTFYCDQNYLSSLPTLPDSLTYIDCGYNALTSLPTLPAHLITLACVYNNLTTLPALPASLYAVDLTSNELVSLPALPASLHALDVPYNQISDLPALPAQLRILLCDSNKLTYLPALPDTLDALSITYNAGIRCLPTLHFFGSSPNIADGTNISCVPNYGSGNSQIFLSYPLCTSGNCSGAGGADLIVCEYDNVSMNAHGAGSWRAMSGNPSLPAIVNPTDPNTAIANFTAAGVYSFIWTSVAGADTVAVTVTAKPNAGADQTICQYNSATMAAVGIGSWSTPTGNPTLTNLVTPSSPTSLITGFDQPGAYSYIWTSNGCTDTVVVRVTAKPNAGADQTISQGSTAVMNASGVGVWTALGSNPATTTITSITAPNTTISGFTATGNYRFVWTSNGCTDTASVNVVGDAGLDQTICLNNTITMAANGSGAWTQLLSNPVHVNFSDTTAYNATVTGFSQIGTYSFVWTTAGMSDTMNISVTAHLAVHTVPIVLLCGSAPFSDYGYDLIGSASGGTGELSFDWYYAGTHIGSGDTLSLMGGGPSGRLDLPYQLIVTDSIGCTGTDSTHVIVTNPTLIEDSVVNTSCQSLTGGMICLNVTGGTAPYSIQWSNAATSQCITSLSSGAYSFTVIDADGCSSSKTDTITGWSIVISDTVFNVSCHGASDGEVDILVSGGIPPYTYTWTPAISNTNHINNLAAGTYCYSVMDSVGCIANHCSTVTEPRPLSIGVNSTNVTCFGSSNGTVSVIATGGTIPYNYQWTNSLFGNIDSNLSPGNYCVTVMDANLCTVTDCALITEPTLLSVMDSVHNVSCAGGNDGGICAFASGGLTPYTWEWSNTNTTSCAGVPGFGLVAGNYCLTVVDAMGCAAYLCDSVSSGNDCIWPGDADANNLVDNNDLLPIGLGYDSTGTARSSVSIVWQADAAADWSQSFGSYTPVVNYKHADCNGDGTIDALDTTAILQNFGLTHAKNNGGPGPWRSGIPGIKAVLSADSLYAGDTLTVTFVLGDTLMQVNNLYGLAFTYNFDPIVVDSTFTTMTFGNSWLGSANDKIFISKSLNGSGQIKAAVTRIDHTNRSGYGALARAKFKITTDNISGKDLVYYSAIGFVSDVRAIDDHGTLITLNAGADTAHVGYTPTGIREINTEKVYPYPNPAHDKVTIQADHPITDVSISNIAGQVVCHKVVNNTRSYMLDVSALDEGLYFVEIKTASSAGIAKLSVVK